MAMMCGDASHLVRCDGYSYNYYLSNDEKGTDLSFELILEGFKSPLGDGHTRSLKSVQNIFTIGSPKGSITSYRYIAKTYGAEMIKGTFKPDYTDKLIKRDKGVIEDLQKAIADWKNSQKPNLDPLMKNELSLDTFKINSSSELYIKCEKKMGKAPKASEMTAEQQERVPEGNAR
jgi:hypothetical protein